VGKEGKKEIWLFWGVSSGGKRRDPAHTSFNETDSNYDLIETGGMCRRGRVGQGKMSLFNLKLGSLPLERGLGGGYNLGRFLFWIFCSQYLDVQWRPYFTRVFDTGY